MPGVKKAMRVRSNPSVLRAIVEMNAAGKPRQDICDALRISQATYYRCLGEIGRRKPMRPHA